MGCTRFSIAFLRTALAIVGTPFYRLCPCDSSSSTSSDFNGGGWYWRGRLNLLLSYNCFFLIFFPICSYSCLHEMGMQRFLCNRMASFNYFLMNTWFALLVLVLVLCLWSLLWLLEAKEKKKRKKKKGNEEDSHYPLLLLLLLLCNK